MQHNKRPLAAERLEDRQLLSSDSGAFFGFGSLSASIAPDNTRIGFRTSQLQSAFDARFGQNQWQSVIERALQTWAREAEINIGFVADSGAPAGVYGPSRGDSRFGDIRFFGTSLGSDVWAEAISENARGAGTWAGDIIFNVDAPWRDLHDLETVALHEAGHIMGLEHSTDPNSPMFAHRPSANLLPTAADLALLQTLHGPRDPDPAEGDKGNDSLKEATRIKGNERDEISSNDDFNGQQIWVQFGDLLNAHDQDLFEIHIDDAYSGPLAVEVRSKGLSLAKLHAEILDRNGRILSSGSVNQMLGGIALLQVDQVTAEEKYFVRVSATDQPFWSQGDYAVTIATIPTLNQSAEDLDSWRIMMHRWFFESQGAQRGFSYELRNTNGDGFSLDDLHLDDEPLQARPLPASRTTPARTVYTTVGTVSNLVDVDHWRFTTPDAMLAGSKLLVDLQSLEHGKLIPNVQVLDETLQPVPFKPLSVGYGTTLMLVENIAPNREYFIRLDSSGIDAASRTGNYSLNLELSPTLQPNDLLISGVSSRVSPKMDRTLYLALPQVMSFSLQADLPSENYQGNAQAVFQLFDEQRQQLHNIIAPVGKMRSLPGVLLDAGQYYLQISIIGMNEATAPVAIELSSSSLSDPIGPLIDPVDLDPNYECEFGGDFCYPDGTETSLPIHVGPGPDIPLPAEPIFSLDPNPPEYFWENDIIFSTNPVDRFDTNGDGILSPVDVLLVVNYLNSFGSGTYPALFAGYVDTNADHLISAVDALLVINAINSSL